jgi:hypothetical protein
MLAELGYCPVGFRSSTAALEAFESMSYRSHYLDLDPTYKDAFGRPLLRLRRHAALWALSPPVTS